jgi:hypothetical protein
MFVSSLAADIFDLFKGKASFKFNKTVSVFNCHKNELDGSN